MKMRILEAARQDLLDGFRFYEAQTEGVGIYFLDTLFADIDGLRFFAGIHPLIDKTTYRLLSKRFPFAVYYRIDGETVTVHAVLDCRRSPAWTRERIDRAGGRGEGLLFRKGEVVRKVPASELADVLVAEAKRLAEEG